MRLGNRVESVGTPRATAKHPAHRQPGALGPSISFDRFLGVRRTAWIEAAGGGEKRGYAGSIPADHVGCERRHTEADCDSCRSSAIRSPASLYKRCKSARTSRIPDCLQGGLATRTMSTPSIRTCARISRKASRRSLLHRFRCTAPPILRLATTAQRISCRSFGRQIKTASLPRSAVPCSYAA
jgi:hypothetical protein